MTAMNCPVCNAAFRESLHDGILIDICTQCRGVWLDRGELEKLLSAVRKSAEPYQVSEADRERDSREYRRDEQYQEYRGHKRDDDDDDDDDDRRRYRNADNRYHEDNRHRNHPQDRDNYRKRSKLESLFGMFD